MEQSAILVFTATDWGRLIIIVILSFRISFAVPECPLFDYVWARKEVQLGAFLDHFCKDTDLTVSSRKVDVLSASRVVMRVVKEKFDKKLQRESSSSTGGGCPMLDGSLEQYFPLWDAGLNAVSMDSSGFESRGKQQQPVFHDLWATMTMSWVNDDSQL